MSVKLFEEDEGKSVVNTVWSELEREGLSLPGTSIRAELIRGGLRQLKQREREREKHRRRRN